MVLAVEGAFSFTGDPVGFTLFAEAEGIHSAYQFDPFFAVNCSVVDPLPHQVVEGVYKYLLPLPNIRFLLANDTGAGKTIMRISRKTPCVHAGDIRLAREGNCD